MANRFTTHILKNSDIVNRPLPSTLLKGEPIINTADGIMYFSGVTTSTNEWTPAGTGTTANFFEVGSNLYDLKLRNRITKYEGISGSGLIGKFLSGTTNGFVLADISSIAGIDTYVTGFTYSNNVATIRRNQGQPDLSILINTMTGLTINGNLTVSGTETVNNITITGTGLYNTTATGANTTEIVNYGSLTAYTSANDVYVTGGTISYTGPNGTLTLNRKSASPVSVTGFTDIYTTGGTYNAGTLTINKNDNTSFNITGLTTNDTFVTGFTYTPASNTLTIKQNQGQPDLTAQINSVSGLSVSNLTAGRVVYVGTSGLLTDEAGFTYDAGTNTFSVPSDGTVNVGTGGLNVDGDTVIQGSLTVFGPSVSAFTSQLYVEDPNIFLNYNPTGSTTVTSIGSGWSIQDGNGITGGTVNLNINRMDSFTGLTATEIPSVTEYTASTGYANRGWITQLNDIVIRSTNVSTPNGVRVLAEFDTLDGGSY